MFNQFDWLSWLERLQNAGAWSSDGEQRGVGLFTLHCVLKCQLWSNEPSPTQKVQMSQQKAAPLNLSASKASGMYEIRMKRK